MDSPVKVQQYKLSVGRVVKMASLDSTVKKLDRKRARKSKRRRRNEPKDILKTKWRANVDMKLLSIFPSLEYREHDYFEDVPSNSTIFEAVRLMQNDIALGEKGADISEGFLNVAKDEQNESTCCRRISIMEPLRKKYKPSKWLAVSDDEQFLINFQRNTHEFQKSLIRLKEFSEANIITKRERDDDLNQEIPNSKNRTRFVVS